MKATTIEDKIDLVDWWTPSLYRMMKGCFLMGVLSANQVPTLLPRHPDAFVGNVVHRLLELTKKGNLLSIEDFNAVWDKEIDYQEQKMKQSFLHSRLVPLKIHSQEYYIKKEQCKLSVKRALECRFGDKSDIISRCSMVAEGEIRVDKYAVRGRPDLVIQRGEYVKIIDYKTGSAVEQGKKGSIVKKWATEQLQLYAAMYYCAKGIWPSELSIITGGGTEYPVSPDAERAIALFEKGYRTLRSVNSVIGSSKTNEELLWILARPSPSVCKICLYRPICNAYWETRTKKTNLDWPYDISGEVFSIKKWGDHWIEIAILQEETDKKVLIIGVPKEILPIALKEGSSTVAYSLKKTPIKGRYQFQDNTTFIHYNS